ncbi:MAG: transposase, partial [Chloroflexaceae bacterium]
YKLKTGCQGELLPRSFPPKSTVHYYFQQWTRNGIWAAINDALRRRVRVEVAGREHVEPTGGGIDTQSVESSVAGGPERGFDGGKKVVGRTRHPRTDMPGLLVPAVVPSARRYDGVGARQVVAATKARGSTRTKVWADQTNRGELGAWMADNGRGAVAMGERLPGQKGFEVQPKRRVVERTHAWLSGTRQLSREDAHTPRHSERWRSLASIRLLGRRLAKAA